jgi:hypothetical protein
MNTEPASINQAESLSKHARKRTAAQRAADLSYAEHHHLRGRTHTRIAEMLSMERGYSISRQQIAYDLKGLEQEWVANAQELIKLTKARALKSLAMQEAAAWDGWEASHRPAEAFTTSIQSLSRRKDARANFAGDPAYLKIMLEIHDRRARLLGLDVPVDTTFKNSPNDSVFGGQDELTDEESETLLERHYERRIRKVYAEKHGLNEYSLELLPPRFVVRGQDPAGEGQ